MKKVFVYIVIALVLFAPNTFAQKAEEEQLPSSKKEVVVIRTYPEYASLHGKLTAISVRIDATLRLIEKRGLDITTPAATFIEAKENLTKVKEELEKKETEALSLSEIDTLLKDSRTLLSQTLTEIKTLLTQKEN